MINDDKATATHLLKWICLTIILLAIITAGGCLGSVKYKAWSTVVQAEADLTAAQHTRRIVVEQAEAELEAADAQATAILVVGEAAQKYPEYRQQMFMQAYSDAVNNGSVKMILVPTEANVPILMSPNTIDQQD